MTATLPEADTTTATAPAGAAADHSSRNTTVLVLFTAITNLADGALKVALPLIAVSLTSSPMLVSGVYTAMMLPWLFAALHVGVLVDRVDRRVLLWLANLVRIAVVGVFLVATLSDAASLPMIYVGGVLLGVAEVVALTSAAALIPTAVAPPARERANSWLTGAETVCNEFVGPFVGGVLVAAGAGVVLGSTALGYLLTTATLLFLVGRFRVARTAQARTATVHGQIREGLSFLWRQKLLRVMTLLVGVLVSLWGAWLALMPLFATTRMGLSPSDYGLLVGALGAGGVCGSLLVFPVNRLIGRRWAMFANIPFTAALVAAPAVSTDVWVVGVGAFLGGFGGGLWVVNARTISQTLVSERMMGRYSAVSRLFGWGAGPVGALVAGVVAEWWDPQFAFGLFAVFALVVVVPFLRVFSPSVAADTEHRIAEGTPSE